MHAAYKLTERQRDLMLAVFNAGKGRTGVKSTEMTVGVDVPTVYEQLKRKGLMEAHGQKYGAKRYFLTAAGWAAVIVIKNKEQ